MTKANAHLRHKPRWVRERERPTTGVDDATYGRFDKRNTVQGDKYIDRESAREVAQKETENARSRIEARIPGYSLEDRALQAAAGVLHQLGGGINDANKGLKSWLSIASKSPQELGVSKFDGNPEEASRLVKVAARTFGAALVGIAPLDKRHVYSNDADGKAIVFDQVPRPYEDDVKRVIPEQCRYTVVVALQMSRDTMARAPTALAHAAVRVAYSRLDYLVGTLAEFIRGLGYLAVPSTNDTAATIPLALEAGLGELGRMNRLVTPRFGPMVRLAKVFTDLPLACDKPVDFGLLQFCRTCLKCAAACPAKALSFEPAPNYQVRGPWNNPGHEGWFEDSTKCWKYWRVGPGTNCGICFAVCPFAKPQGLVHTAVKATVATTPAFNRFFVLMNDVLGYGKLKDPKAWWGLNLPEYGVGSH